MTTGFITDLRTTLQVDKAQRSQTDQSMGLKRLKEEECIVNMIKEET